MTNDICFVWDGKLNTFRPVINDSSSPIMDGISACWFAMTFVPCMEPKRRQRVRPFNICSQLAYPPPSGLGYSTPGTRFRKSMLCMRCQQSRYRRVQLSYNGGSKVYSAFGEEIGSIPDEKEGITTVSVNLTALNQFREKFPVWKDADEFQLRHS